MDFTQVYNRQFSRVYRTALIYLKNKYDAEDACSTVFYKFMQKPVEFASEEHEKAWFITVTKNHCKDTLKSYWRRNVVYDDEPALSIVKEDTAFDGSTQPEGELSEVLAKLPDKYREVLYLFYYEDYSVKEMSKILNRNESTIQTQLAAARKKVKALLEKNKEE